MKRIKVLFLIHDLGGGGAEKVLVNLVNHLDHKVFDIRVKALFGGGTNEKLISKEVTYRYVWPKSFPGNSRILRRIPARVLHRLFIKEKFDIEIAYLEDICAKVVSGCDNPATKTVCWIHTDLRDLKTASRGFKNICEAGKAFVRFDQIVCVSQTVKTDFYKLFPKIKEPVVLYNTLESEKILESKDEPIQDLLFADDEIKLVFVGKLSKQKGIDRVVRIVKKLHDETQPVHLYVLGDGPERASTEAYIEEQQLSSSITLLGYQDNPYKYVSRCDLFVCASLWEGFSTAATEALIVGTPVCTVEVSGMKEMLGENNDYGVVTENSEDALYEGIKILLDDPKLLAHYKHQAGERGKFFSTENTVREVEELLVRRE